MPHWKGRNPLIAPLRKHKLDGTPYARPSEIEQAIAVLLALPIVDVVRRSRIRETGDADYIPSECILHFFRQPTIQSDERLCREFFEVLRDRVARVVPVIPQKVLGHASFAEKRTDLDVRDAVLGRFLELICADRIAYEPKLDFFEVRFNSAIAKLRATAREKVNTEKAQLECLTHDTETMAPSDEMEAILANAKDRAESEKMDFLYRSKFFAAINSLPTDERRVIELLLEGRQIESNDDTVLTIVKILGCTEKTVRNRRDRAFARLRDILKEDEDT